MPLGGVRVLIRMLFRVLRIMFAIGWCQGDVQGVPDYVCYWAVSGCCQGAVEGAVQGAIHGAPDHVCHWAVLGCCPVLSGCSGLCFIGRCQGAVQGAVEGYYSGCSGSYL